MKHRLPLPPLLGMFLVGLLVRSYASAAGLTDGEIQAIRTDSRRRCEAFFIKEAGQPFVPAAIRKDWESRGDFTRHYNQSVVLFAFRAFQLNEQLPAANRALREMCQYHLDRPQTLLEIHSFPWTLSMLPQLCQLYGPEGTRTPGLISPATHAILLQTMWAWAREKSRIAAAELKQSQTWYVTDSENHHANHFVSCWAVSLILAHDPEYRDRKYNDGRSPGEHVAAWTAYLREYLRERARKGMTIEIDSPSYATTTLTAFYRIYELTDDSVLKQRAGDYITLFWALWAEHQIDGVGGGAKTRTYADSARRGTDFMRRASWYALGMGDPNFVHASMLPFVMTTWEMPAVVIDLALDVSGRGTYEVRQRRMGLAEPGYSKPHNYRIRTDTGGILRYGYCTPDFIMGSLLTEARPEEDWAAISSQNRWTGVIFRGDPDARIYPATVNRAGESIYNGHWEVQAAGTLIAQKLKTSRRVDEWRVWFAKSGLSAPVREGGWVFAEAAGAYAAVNVVRGEAAFLAEGTEKFGRWLACADDSTPVIVEVAPKSNGQDYAAFRRAILARSVALEGGVLTHTSLKGDRFTFFVDQSRPPEVNGRPVDLEPAHVFDSPFVQSLWNSGVVTVQKGARSIVLDFNW
ncbi:MAG: hypothetical protein EXS37_09975 [Opitutus sp.]|nr:hypothetical protein [Opitutus sp.]